MKEILQEVRGNKNTWSFNVVIYITAIYNATKSDRYSVAILCPILDLKLNLQYTTFTLFVSFMLNDQHTLPVQHKYVSTLFFLALKDVF
jgi:hypothetical protein